MRLQANGLLHKLTNLGIAAVMLVLSSRPALAWGVAGHHIVAAIAWSRLSPAAQASIRQILDNGAWDLVQISTCPDVIRDTRPQQEQASPMLDLCRKVAGQVPADTGPWHYIDVPLFNHSKDLSAYCPNGNCLPEKLKEFERRFVSSSDPAERRTALMFIVHFMGDIHQPLHCVERLCDQGGNLERVDFVFSGTTEQNVSLHHVWDTSVVGAMMASANTDELRFANELAAGVSAGKARQWSRATVDGMVWEGVSAAKHAYSHIPVQDFCPKPPPHPIETALRTKYDLSAEQVVREQLMKAGVRLAAFLESAVGNRNSEATK